jgi:hypothetical protein
MLVEDRYLLGTEPPNATAFIRSTTTYLVAAGFQGTHLISQVSPLAQPYLSNIPAD